MAQVLYRKYRPRNFDDIFGQSAVKKTLETSIQNDNIAHAYLFSGPRGTGKTSMARIFAKKVNKIEEEGDAGHLDIIEIDAASNRGIEEVRELRQKINFAPSSLEYKVYIIDEVHMLTKEAFNALLKTLEEPPSHVIFILATTEVNKVPITVLSRTQRFDFKLAKKEVIISKLSKIIKGEGVEIDKEGLDLIAKLGRGSFRDTETILEKILHSTSSKKISEKDIQEILGITSLNLIEDFIDSIVNKRFSRAFEIVADVENSGVNVSYFYSQVLEEFRRLLILSQTSENKNGLSGGMLVKIISILIEANGSLKYSPSEILTLELALTKISELMGNSQEQVQKFSKVEKKQVTKKKQEKEGVKESKEEEEGSKTTKEEGESKVGPVSATSVDFVSVKNSWKEFLDALKPYNHHLVAFMKKGEPVDIKDGKLIMKVGYKFHKQRIEKQNSQEAIQESFKSVIGQPLRIECIVDGSMKANKEEEPKMDSNEDIVEEIFGD